ncbi:MAG: hypothetical protein ACK5WD_08935 [bacterium]|jgi:hypothetical protein
MNAPDPTPQTAPAAVECPRCGHLLGVMAAEAERRGETHGTCSECGLDVEWRKLRLATEAPVWFIESRYSPRNIVRRAFGTLVRTARPFRFWKSIDLSLALSRRRLLVFVLVVLAVLHCFAATQRILERGWTPWAAAPAASVSDACTIGRVALAVVAPLSRFDGAGVVYAAHQATGKTDALGLVWESIPALAKAAIPLQDGRITVKVVQVSPTQSTIHHAYPNARELLMPVLRSSSAVVVPATLLAPLTLLLLPTSLRRARIRPRHFMRLMAYTTALLIPITACVFVAETLLQGLLNPARSETRFHLHPFGAFGEVNPAFFLLLLVLTLNAIWLTAAASRYLRLPNARGVGVACALIPMLVACVFALIV